MAHQAARAAEKGCSAGKHRAPTLSLSSPPPVAGEHPLEPRRQRGRHLAAARGDIKGGAQAGQGDKAQHSFIQRFRVVGAVGCGQGGEQDRLEREAAVGAAVVAWQSQGGGYKAPASLYPGSLLAPAYRPACCENSSLPLAPRCPAAAAADCGASPAAPGPAAAMRLMWVPVGRLGSCGTRASRAVATRNGASARRVAAPLAGRRWWQRRRQVQQQRRSSAGDRSRSLLPPHLSRRRRVREGRRFGFGRVGLFPVVRVCVKGVTTAPWQQGERSDGRTAECGGAVLAHLSTDSLQMPHILPAIHFPSCTLALQRAHREKITRWSGALQAAGEAGAAACCRCPPPPDRQLRRTLAAARRQAAGRPPAPAAAVRAPAQSLQPPAGTSAGPAAAAAPLGATPGSIAPWKAAAGEGGEASAGEGGRQQLEVRQVVWQSLPLLLPVAYSCAPLLAVVPLGCVLPNFIMHDQPPGLLCACSAWELQQGCG